MKQSIFRRRAKQISQSARNRHSMFGIRSGKESRNLFGILLAAFLFLLIGLAYKIAILQTVSMLVLATGIWAGRDAIGRVNMVFVLGLLYIASATVSAFLVSTGEGMYRTAQFCIVAGGLTGIYLYSWHLGEEHALRALKLIAIVSVAIFAHLIIYHLSIGKYQTWKYLSDTKTVISLTVFLCFALQDEIRRRVPFPIVMAVLVWLIAASAERKAFLLFVIAAAFSTLTWRAKIFLFGGGILLILLAASTGWDNGYLANRFQAAPIDVTTVSDRYFSTFQNIGDYSDLVREFVNRNAWQLFKDNPFLGVGATGYRAWAFEVFGATDFAMNVHGEVHRVPAEGGIVGIVIAIAYLAATIWRAFHFAFLRPERTGTALERTPLLLCLYVMSYAYAEAIDTGMLVLIGVNSVVAARLPAPSLGNLMQRRLRRSGRRTTRRNTRGAGKRDPLPN
ncbi:O-antigen ligase family protein [uncultured Croceicoccus sp.]|uniref:O-antigen ligase family protein n=1 Tax=uncultured Croceicoccus sp. TaxID=1295329 RepID=UPI002635FC3D|nr:O-antigen ligase family protein [uncultured Croceicoccus sp.]